MIVPLRGLFSISPDVTKLRHGMPLTLLAEPDNPWDGNAVAVLAPGTDPYSAHLSLRQAPDVQGGLQAGGVAVPHQDGPRGCLTVDEIRDRVRAYRSPVPGLLGYLQRQLAARVCAEEWTATLHSVEGLWPGATPGLRVDLRQRKRAA